MLYIFKDEVFIAGLFYIRIYIYEIISEYIFALTNTTFTFISLNFIPDR